MTGSSKGLWLTKSEAAPDVVATVIRAAIRPPLKMTFWKEAIRPVRISKRTAATCTVFYAHTLQSWPLEGALGLVACISSSS